MQPDSRHAGAPGPRLRISALPQTTDAQWLPMDLHALHPSIDGGIPLDSTVESQQFLFHRRARSAL
jgi:hypothetical protein